MDRPGLPVQERGEGASVVLVQGTGPGLWGEVPSRLEAEGMRVVSYERRGFGAAPGPAATELSTHAEDLGQVIEDAGAAPAIVLGWSMGGVIALELAAKRPELVAALALLEPPLHVAKRLNAGFGGLRAIGGAIVRGKLGRAEAGARRFARWSLQRADGIPDSDRLGPDEREALTADSAAMLAELELGTGEHLDPDLLAKVTCPVVWVVADESPAALRKASNRGQELIPDVKLVEVRGSGHAIALARPDAVTEAVCGLRGEAIGGGEGARR